MNDCDQVLLSTAYLPNIQYFSKIIICKSIFIEVHENFQKQSFRNRATILGANGPLDLVIPVIKPEGNHTRIDSVLIDNSVPWQRVHWKAIVSAYRNSPFFDIFEQEVRPLYLLTEKFLLDWNFLVLDHILSIAGVQKKYSTTEMYVTKTESDSLDYRNKIHPKKRMQMSDPHFEPVRYLQVFSNKFDFTSNLSIIDLLFNEGPQAISICRQCYKK
jgi:WbqC-like protein family